ncbi:MAG: hypothetical protein IT274_03410 [Chitinophagales bacterium]|nr:hypothetical protein [Chitinophagales bacterium]
MRKTTMLILALIVLIQCSCTKEGKTGPVGPEGSANVIYSPWQTSPHNSRDTTIDGTCVKIRHLDAPALTDSILKTGIMLTYFRVSSIGPYALPYTSDAGGATNTIAAIYGLGKIYVYRHTFGTCRFTSSVPASTPGQPVMVSFPQSLEYRYVFVPGGQALRTSKPLKQMSYKEVCAKYNIPL